MRYPLVICRRNSLIVVGQDFFEGIGQLDLASGLLDLGVGSNGDTGLNWFMDADGCFYSLTLMGMAPATLLQKLGIKRRRERFRISEPARLTARQLSQLIHPLDDENPDFANVAHFKEVLKNVKADQLLGRDEMKNYLGE